MEQKIQTYQKNDVSVLAIFAVLSESWKLLVVGPLIVGLLVALVGLVGPKTYESTAILRLEDAKLQMINAAPVTDFLIKKLGLLFEFNGQLEDAREYLNKKIVAIGDKKTGLGHITCKASTPESAQELCKAAIEALMLETMPNGKEKKRIEQQILSNDEIIENLNDTLDRLQAQIVVKRSNDWALDIVMKHYMALINELSNRKLQNIEYKARLEYWGSEVYVQPPSLPIRQKRSWYFLYAILASGLALMTFILIRNVRALVIKEDEEM